MRSRHANMKELRPGSTGRTEIWSGWYDTNIPIADDRFDEHQKKAENPTKQQADAKGRRSKGKGR